MTELMGELMAELPRVRRGPLDSLYAALRRRAPQIAATRPDREDAGLRVGYRGQTATVIWDGELGSFAWESEAGGQIGSDAEKAAEVIAWTMGAPVNPGAPY
ncbi:hypothetical protein [Actinomadura sp. 7K507]|uniref:hypothetical protein n=1 Tax=Actinomadura sp. 7K507 TaxID=2530365 RepID=UPI00104490BC|nr:hypothetical protein [Actinomadura sp. 7K507]TDC86829.1 hypothetical protein E1285_22080 [Actinomadura sp. 7K507]